MLGLAFVPALIQLIGFIFLPESPRWLMIKEREDIYTARDVLVRIRGIPNVDEEMTSLRENLKNSKTESSSDSGPKLLRVLTTPQVRRALFVGVGLQVFESLSGVNAALYYSSSVLKMAGFSVTSSIWLVLIPNTVNLLAMGVAVYLMDRIGRRTLLLGSLAGVTIALVILATGFQLSAVYSPQVYVTEILNNATQSVSCLTMYSNCDQCTTDTNCGFCYDALSNGSCLPVDQEEQTRSLIGRCNNSDQSGSVFTFAYGYCPSNYTWVPVLGLALYVIMFATGLGPIPWAVNSEIYPLWARGTCTSITGGTTWTLSLIVSLTFLTLTETITKYGTFWMYAGICVLGFLFVFVFLPETKGRTLEEVEQFFMTSGSRDENLYLLK